jgi:hypothetical protein
MAFKPKSQQNRTNFESDNPGGLFPVPKAGSRKARISLIVDLGTQPREDFEDPETGEVKPQKPCQQVAVFADLTADNVDYGGEVGKQHYRLLVNPMFAGVVKGINFTAVPPKDAKGNQIKGKPWGLHPANVLTKIAKAIGKPEVIESMDISELLDTPFMATVEVKETDSGKVNDAGDPIIYRNVNFKGATSVPLDDDDNPLPVPELKTPAMCVTFDDAKPEQIKYIRKNLITMIKQALDYEGSQMQKAIEAFEANNNVPPTKTETKPETKKQEAKKTTKPKPEPETPPHQHGRLGANPSFRATWYPSGPDPAPLRFLEPALAQRPGPRHDARAAPFSGRPALLLPKR